MRAFFHRRRADGLIAAPVRTRGFHCARSVPLNIDDDFYSFVRILRVQNSRRGYREDVPPQSNNYYYYFNDIRYSLQFPPEISTIIIKRRPRSFTHSFRPLKTSMLSFLSQRVMHRHTMIKAVRKQGLPFASRYYRGDSGDAETNLSSKEDALLKIAKPKAEEILKNHIKLPTDDLDTRRKRLVYRSKQRGWLEVDLLLGTYASKFVPSMKEEELDQFEDFVNMETIDIYNIITLRLDVPEELKMNGEGVVERIQEWARASPLGKADPDAYRTAKVDSKLI